MDRAVLVGEALRSSPGCGDRPMVGAMSERAGRVARPARERGDERRAVVEDQPERQGRVRLVADRREIDVGPRRIGRRGPEGQRQGDGSSASGDRPRCNSPTSACAWSLSVAETTDRPAGRPASARWTSPGPIRFWPSWPTQVAVNVSQVSDTGAGAGMRRVGSVWPGHERGAVGLAVAVGDGQGQGLAVQVAVGAEVEVGPGRVVGVADQLGVPVQAGIDPERPRHPGRGTERGRWMAMFAERLESARWASWTPSGPTSGPGPVSPGRPARATAAETALAGMRRFGSAVPPLTNVGGRGVVVGQVDLERAPGLDLVGLDVEIGGRGAGGAHQSGRPRAIRPVIDPLPAAVASDDGLDDLPIRREIGEQDIDVLNAVRSGSRRTDRPGRQVGNSPAPARPLSALPPPTGNEAPIPPQPAWGVCVVSSWCRSRVNRGASLCANLSIPPRQIINNRSSGITPHPRVTERDPTTKRPPFQRSEAGILPDGESPERPIPVMRCRSRGVDS